MCYRISLPAIRSRAARREVGGSAEYARADHRARNYQQMEHTFSFGAWLQQRRKALDLTQAELGQCVGCSADHIRNLEADRRRPSKEIAERLLPCLQIPEQDHPAFLRFARGESSRRVPSPLHHR